jgi:CRISPR-associated protein (Cas_Cmr3).
MMYAHMIVPQAPLVFRSGRPFGEGSRDGANFPWPSSLAGVLRSQVMDDRGWHGKLDDAQQQALRGSM